MVSIEISPGELIDKITILNIKARKMTDPRQLANVNRELEYLCQKRMEQLEPLPEILELEAMLQTINEQLWAIEDQLRQFESEQAFDSEFVELARLVYKNNDHRAKIKKLINELLRSPFVEEKSYHSACG